MPLFIHSITVDVASRIVDGVLAEGRSRGFAPLTAVVLDVGGQIKVLKRDDGASLLRPEIAVGKAWGALSLGFGGRELARRVEKMPAFFNALSDMSGGRVVPVPGGILIRDSKGVIIGALGISGETSINDEICGVAAVAATGLVADTGDPA
jgi:uncharacterized protein GlcG (DUF336 family)